MKRPIPGQITIFSFIEPMLRLCDYIGEGKYVDNGADNVQFFEEELIHEQAIYDKKRLKKYFYTDGVKCCHTYPAMRYKNTLGGHRCYCECLVCGKKTKTYKKSSDWKKPMAAWDSLMAV